MGRGSRVTRNTRWEGFELSGTNHLQLLVPAGFARSFCVLSDVADVPYKQDEQDGYSARQPERGFVYNDPDVEWPLPAAGFLASERDATAPRLRELAEQLLSDW